ncbi:uncharacterized protein LOC135816151 [Sycon ciliatum]|uniref:uncharacterized protein LOC135816151 n=1 Tax=Sycon ciliatum TaxID=27933 RepID=UPI0020ABB3DA|eukprot:scpid21172/ scgid23770/ 
MPKRKVVKSIPAAVSRKSTRLSGSPAKRTSTVKASDSADGFVQGRTKWTANKTLNEIRKAYEENSNLAYAASIKQYMRNQFEFYGLKAPVRRRLDAQIAETVDFAEWTGERLHSLITLLWAQTHREYQHFAVELARKHLAKVLYDFDHSMDLLRRMITTKSWWDTVDMIAPHLVGALVTRYPARGVPLMDEWIQDKHLWIRRAAILHQLAYKKDCNEERLYRYCLACCAETDFFIRKAIGWALRQHAYLRPSSIKGFVSTNDEKLSSLSKREALKHLGGWPSKK